VAGKEELREERIKKLEAYQASGASAYPIGVPFPHTLSEVKKDFASLSKDAPIRIAGRVRAIRGQGAIAFVDLDDGTERFQVVFKKDDIAEARFALFRDTVDIADIIEVTGKLFTTERGMDSLLVSDWLLLTKTLLPLPDKWHGLQDLEERFRRRYLDTLSNEEVKARFVLRSRIISKIRSVLDEAGYLEVETPMMQAIPGGTNAEPFKTHHNALDMELFMRIAPELYLKRLLVGGFPKVYELARNFRNEGIDVTHNPEFTMLEFYESYSNAERQMAFVESLFKRIVKDIFGKEEIQHGENIIRLEKPFARVTLFGLFRGELQTKDPEKLDHAGWVKEAGRLGVTVEKGDSTMKIMDTIYKKHIRPKLLQPVFITDYPVDYLPLAKRKANDPKLVDAFQLVIGSVELVKAFSELNDPLDQRSRFEDQEKNRGAGDKEAQLMDEDFIESLEHGMPPAGGVGIGIDRLMMLLLGQDNIREVILFPTLRPR
jgi:lysyl-tRNA synthetase class 2